MVDRIVVFKLHDNSFGIPITNVSEIINNQTLSEVPNKPEFVDGITNLRGRVITILNLRKRFGFPQNDSVEEEKIILIEGTNLGFRVDCVEEIAVPEESQLIDPDEFQKDLNDSFICKLMKTNNGVTIILDPHEIIKHSHMDSVEKSFADKVQGCIGAGV